MTGKPKKYCDGIDCAFCSEKEPCIYKIANRLESELKVKEQECERLKENLPNAITRLMGELDQLKVEKEELEKELRQKKMTILMNNDHYFEVDQENKKLIQRIIEIDRSYKNRQEELEQTLIEIKGIAEEQIPYLDIDKAKTITEVEYDYADKIYNLEQRMYKILQKISEVE